MAPRLSERIFVVVLILYNMGIVIGITRPYEAELDPTAMAASVHIPDTLMQTALQAFGMFLIVSRWPQMVKALKEAWPLVAVVSFAVLSTAWSVVPSLTVRRSVLLIVSTLTAVYVGERFTIEEQVELIAQAFCLMMVTILILRVAAPRYVVDYVSHPGAWKGLSGYKNAFGQYMATASLLFVVMRFRRVAWMRYVFLAAAIGMLLFSSSAASLLCFAMMLPLLPLWRSTRVKRKQRLPLFTAIGICMVGAMYMFHFHSGSVYGAVGRNSTLTGRDDLWANVWLAILRHPLLGYGYDAFWSGYGAVMDIRSKIGWMAQRSDNGYLDFLLGLGFVGMALMACVVLWSLRNAIRFLQIEQRSFALWPVTYVVFYALHNMSESTLLARGGLPDLLLMMTGVSLAMTHRARAHAPSIDKRYASPERVAYQSETWATN